MAGPTLNSSVIIDDYFSFPQTSNQPNTPLSSTPYKQKNLLCFGKEFTWESCLESLKKFVQTDLNLHGKWTSPGGEVKLLTCNEHTLKWYGVNKKKLVVVRNDDKGSLVKKLKNLASLSGDQSSKQNGEAVRVENTSGNDTDKNPSIVMVNLDTADIQSHIDIESSRGKSDAAKTICESGRNSHYYCNELESQLKRIGTNVNFLMNRFETSEAKESISLCSIGTCQTEKRRLMHDLEAANALVKEFKAKFDQLENDKSSLVTAIRIIQEDNNAQVKHNSPKNNPWIKVSQSTKKSNRSQSQSKNKKVDNNITSTNPYAEEQNELTQTQTKSGQAQSDSPNNQRANNRPRNAKESNPTNVVIAGDSMIKHINAHRLSKANTKVRVSTFPGSTTLDMNDYIKPILRKKPDKLILHIGTNSLKGRETPSHCAEEIKTLTETISKSLPHTELAISSLITRLDDESLTNKVSQVNIKLKQFCQQKNWKFIDNANITLNELNRSKIHLYKTGTKTLASNFSKYIFNKID